MYRLCSEKTIEERIIARAQQKMMLDRAVVQEQLEGQEAVRQAAEAAARMVQGASACSGPSPPWA